MTYLLLEQEKSSIPRSRTRFVDEVGAAMKKGSYYPTTQRIREKERRREGQEVVRRKQNVEQHFWCLRRRHDTVTTVRPIFRNQDLHPESKMLNQAPPGLGKPRVSDLHNQADFVRSSGRTFARRFYQVGGENHQTDFVRSCGRPVRSNGYPVEGDGREEGHTEGAEAAEGRCKGCQQGRVRTEAFYIIELRDSAHLPKLKQLSGSARDARRIR